MYIDKVDGVVKKYNNTNHNTIKMKPVNVKSNTYVNSSKEINNRDPKFKIGNIVRISQCKNVSTKSCVTNWSEEVFMIKRIRNIEPWTYVINDLKGEEIVETFYKKELQKKIKESLELNK